MGQDLIDILADMAITCEPKLDASPTEFRDCMIEEANKQDGNECGLSAYLVVELDTPEADAAQKELAHLIESNQVKVMDANSEEAKSIVNQVIDDGDKIPTLVISNCESEVLGQLAIRIKDE